MKKKQWETALLFCATQGRRGSNKITATSVILLLHYSSGFRAGCKKYISRFGVFLFVNSGNLYVSWMSNVVLVAGCFPSWKNQLEVRLRMRTAYSCVQWMATKTAQPPGLDSQLFLVILIFANLLCMPLKYSTNKSESCIIRSFCGQKGLVTESH